VTFTVAARKTDNDLYLGHWNKSTLYGLAMPGGLLLLAAFVLVQTGVLSNAGSSIEILYYATIAAGILLALRFRSSRILFALIFLSLSRRAIEFFTQGHVAHGGPGYTALQIVAVLLPLDFIVLGIAPEGGFAMPALLPWFGLLLGESIAVAVICSPDRSEIPFFFRWQFWKDTSAGPLSQLDQVLFVFALLMLLIFYLRGRKTLDAGLFWSLLAALLGFAAGGVGKASPVYLTAAVLIVVSAMIENSYLLAYHDELTALPGRRAFNEALLHLSEPYTVAMVDVDHFKSVNDTYGHDTGDEVLRLIASHLSRVTGGGKAYRFGGEEFSVLFQGKSITEAAEHLEALRTAIQSSQFRLRADHERRQTPRGADRRVAPAGKSRRRKKTPAQKEGYLLVTVSIGAAEPSNREDEPQNIVEAADSALYRAKQSGRNRVELAPTRPRRVPA
jgi:diguanylate cyclase (GGDEF)-like protein